MKESKIFKQINETNTPKNSLCLLKTRFFDLFKVLVALVVNPVFGHNSWECFEHKLHYFTLINFKRKKKL